MIYSKANFINKNHRYLLTNGLGSFTTMSILNSNRRSEDNVFMECITPPTNRYKHLHKLSEELLVNGKIFNLDSAEFVNRAKNYDSSNFLLSFENNDYPTWIYQVENVIVKKILVTNYKTNSVSIKYTITGNACLKVYPQVAGHGLGEYKSEKEYKYEITSFDNFTKFSETRDFYINSNLAFIKTNNSFVSDYFYEEDARDGRNSVGSSMCYGYFETTSSLELCISDNMREFSDDDFNNYVSRKNDLVLKSKVDISDEFATTLVKSVDEFLVHRESTDNMTIIAGYPFFADWGRDTFHAFEGSCLVTGRFDEAKSILVSFIKYLDKGLLPNMFPTDIDDPFYNSLDAPLLFIKSVYDYYNYTSDLEFVQKHCMDSIKSIIENFIKGTDFDIKMDSDYLISGGSGLIQLTWMDIRFDEILPTPRHGKPVEINAWWYNALKIYEVLSNKINLENEFADLIPKVYKSFNEKFVKATGGLKDVLSGKFDEDQIRLNQIWAVSTNFSPIPLNIQKSVVDEVFTHLYTSNGLRTLSPRDKQYIGYYGDSHFKRDMSYHQGTTWPFPIGAFIESFLIVNEYSNESRVMARTLLSGFTSSLHESCDGQICEVYDGDTQFLSKGCYAQAWSVAEVLRAYLLTFK